MRRDVPVYTRPGSNKGVEVELGKSGKDDVKSVLIKRK